MEIVPLGQMHRRMQEQGRIRLGEKAPKGNPKALNSFRFTSPDEEAITQIAEQYGGDVGPWNEAGTKQFEVITPAAEVKVLLPPEPLGGTPIYELWSKGGLARRCDGELCGIPTKTPDGIEICDEPCICVANDSFDCKPTTRLNVILPTIRFGGTWRLETHGWNAAHELPGMVEMIQAMQARGLSHAVLALDQRRKVVAGETRKFVVPVLRLDLTPNAIMAGEISTGGEAPQLGAADVPELEAPIIEDSVQPESMDLADAPDLPLPPLIGGVSHNKSPLIQVIALSGDIWQDEAEEYRKALTSYVSNGRVATTSSLNPDEMARMLRGLIMVNEGLARVELVDGKAVIHDIRPAEVT